MGYPGENAFEELRRLLNIPDLGGEDWDLIYADGTRVTEFCDVYEREDLGSDDKAALMQLIVASYDRLVSDFGESHASVGSSFGFAA